MASVDKIKSIEDQIINEYIVKYKIYAEKQLSPLAHVGKSTLPTNSNSFQASKATPQENKGVSKLNPQENQNPNSLGKSILNVAQRGGARL